ncbi:germination protein YpeB [Bacillus sp. FSL W7-1360]
MFRNIAISLLVVMVVCIGYWGYQQKVDKDRLAIAHENTYQRAMHDLAYHIDQIEDELGSVLAMNSERQLSPTLADVWRVTSLAQKSLADLPLQGTDLEQSEEYLFKVGDFSYRTAVRDLEKQPLTPQEYETLQKLYTQAGTIRSSLRETQAMMMRQDMKWLALDESKRDEPTAAAGQNAFEKVNASVQGFSEVEWGATDAAIRNLNGELKDALAGRPKVSKEEAKEKARLYVQLDEEAEIKISDSAKALKYPAYSLVLEDPQNHVRYHMDMSVEGGEPIWFMQDRQVTQTNIGLYEAEQKAEEFLTRTGKSSMRLLDSAQYGHIGVFTFTSVQDEVRIYPDTVIVEVALDDGGIFSYVGRGHIIYHDATRIIPTPIWSKEAAQEKLNPRVDVMESHMAVIENDRKEEVLTYVFYGTIDRDTYRIFINAQTGEEEKVERMDRPEAPYQPKDHEIKEVLR